MPISNPFGQAQTHSGSYTADNTDGKQIAVGFKCSMVIILRVSTVRAHILTPNTTLRMQDSAVYVHSAAKIHASDGFVVDASGEAYTNVGTETYYYWAVSE